MKTMFLDPGSSPGYRARHRFADAAGAGRVGV